MATSDIDLMSELIRKKRNKKISEQSKSLLAELGRELENASKLIPDVYQSLKEDGFNPHECRAIIEESVTVSYRRLMELLPPEAKMMKMARIKPKQSAQIAAEPQQSYIDIQQQPQPQIQTGKLKIHVDGSKFNTLIKRQTFYKDWYLEIDADTLEVTKIL